VYDIHAVDPVRDVIWGQEGAFPPEFVGKNEKLYYESPPKLHPP